MNLHNINTIARYEVKLLRRSWLFRIFAILALLGISLTIMAYQSSIFSSFDTKWPRIAVSSLMPFCTIYFYNIAQSVIVVFLAGSFLKRDKKLDTAEVIYVRPMSNADYIIGKTWGIVKVFLTLNIISLAITAFFNVAINHSPFDIFLYLFYLLTISLPSLLFVLGLSFTAMCLLKNQAVTFIVMLGIIGTVFFYLTDTFYGVFDFFGVTIPAVFSDVTGHANLMLFLLQRFIYLTAGIGFISFTIGLVKRLPHKPWKLIIVHTLGGIMIIAGCVAGLLYILHYQHQLNLRSEYAATFNKYIPESNVSILTHDLTVTPHGKQLEGSSVIQVKNNHPDPLSKIILYLNPGLEISSIESNGTPLPFTRDNQAIIIDKTLAEGDSLLFNLNYQGHIDETICYTDVPEKEYLDNSVPETFYRFGKRYAWLENKFTLLTPETIWYPVAIPPVNPAAPYNLKKNFVNYTLTVNYDGDKTVLSQGQERKEGHKTIFTNRQALPGISLTIADYEKKAIQVDSVDYEILYFKGHDYFSRYFTKLNDTLSSILPDLKNDIELGKGRDYPFSKFILAETPVQFASYIRNWKGYTEYIMPEIVFIPERGATLNSDFAADEHRSKQWRRHDQEAPDETEMAIANFRRFIQSTFTEETVQYGWGAASRPVNPYNIAPMFFAHTGFIRSEEYPVLDVVFNTMQSTGNSNTSFRMWGGIINDQQRANLYLENHSFQAALSDMELKPVIFYELLKLKSNALRNYINTQMPPEEFDRFLKDFFSQYNFTDIPFETFQREFEDQFGVNLNMFIQKWYTEDHSPTVYIRDVDANQVVVEEVTRYQVKFKVNNPSDVDAIITAQIQQGGDFRGGGRRGGGMMVFSMSSSSTQNTPETYIIPAGQAREIKIIVDERPASVTVNMNISHNLPTSHTFNFSKIDNTIADTIAGTFRIDPGIFKPSPNEIIVDNEDRNFKTIESNTRHKLKDMFQKTDDEKYKNFMPWRIPSKWTAIAADYYYGETINSAVYKRKGSGNNSVEWTAELPKDSYYEVFIWNAKSGGTFGMSFGPRRRHEKIERNQTYTLLYDQGKESITIDLEQEDDGWVSLGNYYLPKGTTTISLTDKVSGDYVIADAVKFSLINE